MTTSNPNGGMPVRRDRIHRYVVAYCPHCNDELPDRPLAEVERLTGYLLEEDGRVYLDRGCPRHGRVRSLYEESAELLRYLEQWTAPTKHHTPDSPGNYDPVPAAYLRGLGEMQIQHTCILLEDVLQACNLCCPNCFTSSSPRLGGLVPAESVLANIDQRLERENGRIDVLMISGGEPTLHPELVKILEGLLGRNVIRILINSNGIELARNDELLEFIARHRQRIEVYLQFDGFRQETSRFHRGADLRQVKQLAIERLTGAGVFVTLTMTAALDCNDDEIGDMILYAMGTAYVGGVSIQPQFGSGRSQPIDPMRRLTNTGVLTRLEAQTGGRVRARDLTALPCSHPHCCSVGYMIRTDAGEWRSLAELIGHERLRERLDLVSNRIADRELPEQLRAVLKQSLLNFFSEQSSLSHPGTADILRSICDNCDLGVGTLLRLMGDAALGRKNRLRDELARRVKRITVKPFMDMHTMIEERLLQCCIHVGTQSTYGDQCAPFCAVQAWAPLRRTVLAEQVGEELIIMGGIRERVTD
jgi:hypothetical protein